MMNSTASRLKRMPIRNRSRACIALFGLALLLGLRSASPLELEASSESAQEIRNGVVVNDAQISEASKSARIYIPTKDESAISLESLSAPLIDFDHDASGAPLPAFCIFLDTSSLTELYAPLGVHFSGPSPISGGAILNQCGNFGVPAISGFNFLAFNRTAAFLSGGIPTDPETISFDSPTPSLSLLASAGFDSGTFKLEAFDASNILVSTDIQTAPAASYIQLRVSSAAGIRRVVFTRTDNPPPFVVVAFVLEDISLGQSFDMCLQDDSNGDLFQFNSTSGVYQFTSCSGFIISGTAVLTKRGNSISLQDNVSDRRVMARIDTGIKKATASIQVYGQGRTFILFDRDTSNNTCVCR